MPAEVDSQVFLDSTPTTSALSIDSSDSSASTGGIGATSSLTAQSALTQSQATSDQTVVDLIGELNDRLADLVGPIETMVGLRPTVAANLENDWSYSSGGLAYRFIMLRDGPSRFGWRLEAEKDGGADAAFSQVFAGGIRRNPEAHRGAGFLLLDFSMLSSVAQGTATTVKPLGTVGALFIHAPHATMLEYVISEYTGALGNQPPHSAFFHALHIGQTTGHGALTFLRAGGRRDLIAGPALESFASRVRRVKGVGGWARAVIFSGDVPADRAYVLRECWDGSGTLAYRRVWDCPQAGTNACFDLVSAVTPPIGGSLPLNGTAASPDGPISKTVLRTQCGQVLGATYAAVAANDAEPPADELDTNEDPTVSGAPAAETPRFADVLADAEDADGSPPQAM